MEMIAAREEVLREAANLLLDARRTRKPMVDLPEAVRPETLEEIYCVQDLIAEAYEAIGGWKVGASSADGTPAFAPMPKAWIAASGALLGDSPGSAKWRYRGVEAEITFLIGEDLPVRDAAYSREEVVAAIASCHPAIEVLESGLVDPMTAARVSAQADLQLHGGFVYGPAVVDWTAIDFGREAVSVVIDGAVRVERVGSNAAGDLLRLAVWMANEGAARTGGLKAGDWITTGSWTGCEQAVAGSSVEVRFATAGRVGLRFG